MNDLSFELLGGHQDDRRNSPYEQQDAQIYPSDWDLLYDI
jgi:hypothetical protein